MKKQTGFSLVEIMIGMLLGSVLLGALLNHYLISRRHYASAEQHLTQGYDLQMITDMLQTSIRQAGFTPCVGIGWLTAADRRDKPRSLAAIALSSGTENRLAIKRMGDQFAAVNRIVHPRRLLVEASPDLVANRPVIIADCFHAEIAAIERIKAQGDSVIDLTLKNALQFSYMPPAYVGPWIEEQFWVKKNSAGELALYYQTYQPEELSSFIRSFYARLLGSKAGQILEINLGLADKRQLILNTAVRM